MRLRGQNNYHIILVKLKKKKRGYNYGVCDIIAECGMNNHGIIMEFYATQARAAIKSNSM